MDVGEISAVAGVLAVIVSGAAIAASLKGIRDQLWLSTFSEYTRRYLEIVKELPAALRDPNNAASMEVLTLDEQKGVPNTIRAYFNLCSEEFYLRRRGVLDESTWEIWMTGIRENVRLPWLATSWPQFRNEYSYFPDFCEFMDRLAPEILDAHPASGSPAG